MRPLVCATRGSMLALAQCRAFVASLQRLEPGLETRELQVVTTGDRVTDRPLAEIGAYDLFAKEIEEALLDRRADFAVHSLKDLPGSLPKGLVLACVPQREDARDVLVSPRYGTLEGLPQGARVGTSSPRRAKSLHGVRPDLVIEPLRGNVDTRLQKLDAGECDAIVLARAGLVRLGLEARITQVLGPDVMLPAVGQGALGIECRADDEETRRLLAGLHDPETATCVAAERGILRAVEGDCKTPVAAYAWHWHEKLCVWACYWPPAGPKVWLEQTVPWPADEAQARAVGASIGRELVFTDRM